ncbi:adenylate/guanylate cyclase domain-containing protein [Lentimicrobium sp.]|uniref:adenylate/guanylate cyclase domain-containing protein n=1 Tax=Lentimicrobium sp. TaxID=2034841 RepID=UPI00345E52C8
MAKSRVPKYRIGRVFLFPILLYFMLVFPMLVFMLLKSFPQLTEKGVFRNIQEVDSLSVSPLSADTLTLDPGVFSAPHKIDDLEIPPDDIISTGAENPGREKRSGGLTIQVGKSPGNNTSSAFSDTFSALFRIVILFSTIAGFAVNIPFRRYFFRKRKGRTISPKLYRYCRRFLLYTPLINSGIVLLAFSIVHGLMIYQLQTPEMLNDPVSRRMFSNYLFISLVASLLTVLFIYFWQKHRVHIKYIEHIYTREELQKRIFGKKPGKIRNRLYIASAMTTLLPLTIVLLYLILSLTPIREMGEVSASEMRIMLGRLVDFMGPDFELQNNEDFKGFYYISALDNALMFIGIFSGILVSFIYILFFVNWSTADIVRPVNELVGSMQKTGEGMLDNFTIVRTNDEIGVMSEGYNQMTSRLREYIFRISRMNEAYSRFVPNQFLEFLGKQDFVDIQLGDQVQKEMSVLFSDIRGFTELSEEMSPKENFDFINHYLGYMEPVIRQNNGFIDKFIGDSIMALFHDKVDDAIDAAIQMRQTLVRFNLDRVDQGKPTIDSGIGIHTGNLMLGVVGGEGRMDGTVISDAVNLASRLEGLTKIYHTSIIISEDTLIKLENPGKYNFRFLDVARVKGKKEAVYVFEVLDGDPEEVKALKIETKTLFGKGIDLYKNRKFEEALGVFSEIVKINQQDSVAAFYVNRCRTNIQKGIPDDWSGIEVYDAK